MTVVNVMPHTRVLEAMGCRTARKTDNSKPHGRKPRLMDGQLITSSDLNGSGVKKLALFFSYLPITRQ